MLILLERVQGDDIIEDRNTISHECDHKENYTPATRITLAILAGQKSVGEQQHNHEEDDASYGALQGEVQD